MTEMKNPELQLKILKLLMLAYYKDNVRDRIIRLSSPTFFRELEKDLFFKADWAMYCEMINEYGKDACEEAKRDLLGLLA